MKISKSNILSFFFSHIISSFIRDREKRHTFREKCKILFAPNAPDDPTQEIASLRKNIFQLTLGQKNTQLHDRGLSSIFNGKCAISRHSAAPRIKGLFSRTLTEWPDVDDAEFILIWGSSHTSPQSEIVSHAVMNDKPVVLVEDGFLRSADTWCNQKIDKKYTNGISFTFSTDAHYFDATRSALMERLIDDKSLTFSPDQLARARKCIDFITENFLTKYNHQPIYFPEIGTPGRKKVLVIDQSYGDFSISRGLANDKTFEHMLAAAINENPDADIIIKTHPDTMTTGSSRATGYYSSYQAHDNVYKITMPINPIALLKSCDKVYVCTTQFGFEALMCGKEVHVFGMPFYAGWGLTKDRISCPRRTNTRTLEEVFYIAYILYSHYVSPKTNQRCEIEEAMDYLLELRSEYFYKFKVKNVFKEK